MVPLFLQTFEVLTTEPTPEPTRRNLGMRASHMFIQHRLKMEHFVTILTFHRLGFVVVLHMPSYHFLGIELTLAHIALEIGGAVDFFVLRKVA